MTLTFAVTAVVVLALIVGTFAVALRRERYDLIDIAWGLGFAAVALVTFVRSTGDPAMRVLVTALTAAWGVRLAIHIGLRARVSGEDRRYADMRRRSGPARMFVRVYLVQAVLLWVVSLPVQVAQYGEAPHPALIVAGVAVWLVGFVFEAVGDAQLRRFRADPRNRGRVLDRGLWRYTRHPNYFGDACVWWGLYLLACHSWPAAATIVAPIVMTALLARGSGKPITERHLARSRPDYADYVARTSGFVPLPPRRPATRKDSQP
ncbi:DUF1295 domain-containing protein [Saccharomonospora piscinae]|uniref:DUF1295 domain-containing protein n=1 Tax=Saccharomonospora piscinae TaxID=687388 RepID=UPI001106F67F|nr:DUF1295 domain-containing protein [Saccharomonospora piscinae]TLW94598.1 DUF1295 domain-containing protein [Saccharomonospora piscinae]